MARRIKMDWTKITKTISKQEKGYKKEVDERLYVPKLKDDGTAQSVIRFLWSKDTDIPFVKKYSHGFKNAGGWYIEDCPTTIGKDCPVCKANSVAWNAGNQDLAKSRSRRLSCYANILVVKDPQTPENNGKVFLYRYGKKIHEKIMAKITPPEDGIEEPIMIFDPYDGANFKLIIKTTHSNINGVDKSFLNYDGSTFAEKTEIGTDAKVDKVDKALYTLSEFVSNDNFKSFDELGTRFAKVTGQDSASPTPRQEEKNEDAESAPGAGEDVPEPGAESEESTDNFLQKLRDGETKK